jgi:hypothetical protein
MRDRVAFFAPPCGHISATKKNIFAEISFAVFFFIEILF